MFLNPTNPHHGLKCKLNLPQMQQTKTKNGNLKLYALANMQTKNQTRKQKITPSPRLRQSIIIRSKKVKEGDGEQKLTISLG